MNTTVGQVLSTESYIHTCNKYSESLISGRPNVMIKQDKQNESLSKARPCTEPTQKDKACMCWKTPIFCVTETDQGPGFPVPMSSACLLSLEKNLSHRVSLVREVGRNKGNQRIIPHSLSIVKDL